VKSQYPELPNARWVALRLLDGDERIREAIIKGELGDLSNGDPDNAVNRDLAVEVA
jgi:ferrous iron transport protein B